MAEQANPPDRARSHDIDADLVDDKTGMAKYAVSLPALVSSYSAHSQVCIPCKQCEQCKRRKLKVRLRLTLTLLLANPHFATVLADSPDLHVLRRTLARLRLQQSHPHPLDAQEPRRGRETHRQPRSVAGEALQREGDHAVRGGRDTAEAAGRKGCVAGHGVVEAGNGTLSAPSAAVDQPRRVSYTRFASRPAPSAAVPAPACRLHLRSSLRPARPSPLRLPTLPLAQPPSPSHLRVCTDIQHAHRHSNNRHQASPFCARRRG